MRTLNTVQTANKEIFLASHPALLAYTRAMSSFSSAANTALSITNAINLATIVAQGTDQAVLDDKQKLAQAQIDYSRTLRDFPNDLGRIADAYSKVQLAENQLAIDQRKAAIQMVQNWITVASSVVLVGGQIGQLIAQKDNISANLSQMFKNPTTAAGLLSLGIAAVAIAAFAAGSIIGEAFNGNKDAISQFRKQLDDSFGDNPITNYIILPIAAMIDDLNGAKADWNNDVSTMQDTWIGFANLIISGVNGINAALRSLNIPGIGGAQVPLIKTLAEQKQGAAADATNQFLLTGKIPGVAKTPATDPMRDYTDKVLQQTAAYKANMEKILLNNTALDTNQKVMKDNTDTTKQSSQQIKDALLTVVNPLSKLNDVNTALATAFNTLTPLISTQTGLLQNQENRTVALGQTQQFSSKAGSIQSQIDALNSQRPRLPNLSDIDQDVDVPQLKAQIGQQNAQIDAKIKPLKDQLSALEVGTQAALSNYVASLGLDPNMGLGSVVTSALGGSTGGITSQDVQGFINTHDFGVFTRAALRNDTSNMIVDPVTGITRPATADEEANNPAIRQQLLQNAQNKSLRPSDTTNTDPFSIIPHGMKFITNANGVRTLTRAATGYRGMVSGPTMFMAGEAGPEHVSIKPLGRGADGAGNVYNTYIQPAGSILTTRELFKMMDDYFKGKLKSSGF